MFCVLQSFSHHFLELPIDGRNFAPVDKQFIWLFTGFHTSWVVQDFFHQQYSHNSSPVPNVSLSNRRLSVWQFEHGWGWMSRWHFRTIECLEGGHIVFWKSDFWIWLVQASSRVCLPNYCVSWFALSCLTPVKLGRQLSFCFWRRNQKKRKQNVRHSTQLFDVLDSGHPNQRGDAKSQERRFFLGSGISAGEGGVLCRSASGARSARGARGRKNVVGISQTMMCCRKSTKSKGKGVKELTDRCLKLSLAQLSWWESESGVFFSFNHFWRKVAEGHVSEVPSWVNNSTGSWSRDNLKALQKCRRFASPHNFINTFMCNWSTDFQKMSFKKAEKKKPFTATSGFLRPQGLIAWNKLDSQACNICRCKTHTRFKEKRAEASSIQELKGTLLTDPVV